LDLKNFLKTLKLNENNISVVLGAIVLLVAGILVVNYFRGRLVGQVPRDSTSQAETQAQTHTVAKGENLWQIAEKYYNSGYNWVDIKDANSLTNPDILTEGQTLTIPQVESREVTVSQEQPSESPDSISGATYEVVKGDSLWNIAVRAYGDGYKWVEIARENKLVNPDIIHAGNILVLPR
jgi:nucleoid-associated protein YgaU